MDCKSFLKVCCRQYLQISHKLSNPGFFGCCWISLSLSHGLKVLHDIADYYISVGFFFDARNEAFQEELAFWGLFEIFTNFCVPFLQLGQDFLISWFPKL